MEKTIWNTTPLNETEYKRAMNECAMNESLSVSSQLMQLSNMLHLL